MQPVAVVLACFGGLTLLVALSRWLAGRRWASIGHLVLAALLIAGAAQLLPLAANLDTYQALRIGQPVAQVFCERTGSRTHRVTLTRLPQGRMQVFEVTGDEWRLDARTLAWKGKAVELGLKPRIRLDRLSTRFVRAVDAGAPPPSSYPLSEEAGEDVWAQARTGIGWADYAVPGHAEGPWRPLAPGARFEAWFDSAGLHVRAANEAAAVAMRAHP
jgi:hypothetical protein